MGSATQISEHAVVLAMDYGQFSISGGLGDLDDDLELLEQAQAAQPSAGNGHALVVLSPHQNNFDYADHRAGVGRGPTRGNRPMHDPSGPR